MNPSFIILPHEANLDMLGAARCMTLAFPEAMIVHPQRMAGNAWDMARRAKWFKTVPPHDVKWNAGKIVHLLGISLPRHNPDVMDPLTRFDGEILCHSHQEPLLPFKANVERVFAHSFTAHMLQKFSSIRAQIGFDDAILLKMAVVEQTGAGLSSKTSNADADALKFLSQFPVPLRQISNQVILGLREGQKGILQDLSRNIQDLEINHFPVTLVVIKSIGNVQEISPLMDILWANEDPHILVAGVIAGNKLQVWARSRGFAVNLFHCFKEHRAKTTNRWVTFSILEKDETNAKAILIRCLESGLVREQVASQIMISPAKCVDYKETVANTLDLMLRFNLMCLVAVKDGSFVGMITRRDLDRAIQMDIWESPIEPFIPGDCPVAAPDMPVRVVRQVMAHHNAIRLPVIDRGKVIGIIAGRELIRAIPDPLPLPRAYLPLANPSKLPDPVFISNLVKRVTSLRIFHLLRRIGEYAHEMSLQAYLVGGVVRDILLEKPNLDMDIVLIGDAIPFAGKMRDEFKGKLRIFDRFHTARLTLDDIKIDFSSARIEHYSQAGALPLVEFSGLSNDLFRRDFTINALALDLSPKHFLRLIDFFGGYEDISKKRIRILHSFSFLEDPTRIFRAIRFATRFRFQLSEDTQRALDVAMDREIVGKLSSQRIATEISRSFREEQPMSVLTKFLELGLLKTLHRDLSAPAILPSRFKLIAGMVRRFSILKEPISLEAIHWIALLSRLSPKDADRILKDACYTWEDRETIVSSLEAMYEVPGKISRIAEDDDSGLYNLLQAYPLEGLISLVLFRLDKNGARRVFDFIARLRHIKCEITGKDLIELGLEPGPDFRDIFAKILHDKITGVINDKKGELEHAKRAIQDLRI